MAFISSLRRNHNHKSEPTVKIDATPEINEIVMKILVDKAFKKKKNDYFNFRYFSGNGEKDFS